MRLSRPALAVLPITAMSAACLAVVGCGTTSPTPGAAYGATQAAGPSTAAVASPSMGSTASAAPMTPAKAMLMVRKTKIGYVLVTSTGQTIYWFSKDGKDSGKSACAGPCLTSWPAVAGTPMAASGVQLAGKLGTITRPGGVVQATYNGYPLYTYAEDMSPGQTLGNGQGGVWHVITGGTLSPSPVSAAAASARDAAANPSTAATPAPSAQPSGKMSTYSGGGGGY